MRAESWLLLSAALSAALTTQAANILFFHPFPGKSHHRVLVPIAEELSRRGHNVTLFSPFHFDGISFNIVTFPNYMQELREFMGLDEESNYMENSYLKMLNRHPIHELRHMGDYFVENLLQEKSFQDLIASDSTFDLIVHECLFANEAVIGLQHRFNAHSVELMTFGNSHWGYWLLGNPFDPSYIIDVAIMSSDSMTFKERLENTITSLLTRVYWYWRLPFQQNLMDRYFRYPGWEGRPSMLEMISNISLVLVNTHLSLNYPYPISPNFKEIAGTNIHPNKPLPKDMKKFLDGAKNGVIYFSLGSHIQVSSTLGETLREKFAKVFTELNVRVLWKWEKEYQNLTSNIMISKWFPQQDILAHPNIRMFITQGGFVSMTEAVYHGVPLIGIPILGDQNKNVQTFVSHGYGIHLAYNNLSEASVSWAINEILTNSRYKEKAMEKSRLLRDQPMSPLNTAVYNIEYVLRNGGAHLKPAVTNLKWYQASLLDVYAVFSVLLLLTIFVLYKAIKCLISCCCKNSKRNLIKLKTT